MMNTPHPIRTAKLSIIGLDQYYNWGQCGNLECRKATFYFYDLFLVPRIAGLPVGFDKKGFVTLNFFFLTDDVTKVTRSARK